MQHARCTTQTERRKTQRGRGVKSDLAPHIAKDVQVGGEAQEDEEEYGAVYHVELVSIRVVDVPEPSHPLPSSSSSPPSSSSSSSSCSSSSASFLDPDSVTCMCFMQGSSALGLVGVVSRVSGLG
eukprot:3531778-Rhodomonas_salina.1